MFKFKASDLPEILTRWSARYSVFVPSGSPDNAQMRIWSRRTRKEVRFMEPDEYTNLIVAPKGFVFGEREELFRWEGNEKTCTAISAPSSSSLQEEDKILFGLRPCDTYGLAYMDRFFLGEHHDINYHLRRQHVFIVAVNCLEAGPECYCASMGTGPFAEITAHTEYGMQAGKGYDLLLTPDYGPDHKKGEKGENDWYWVEAGSDRGKALLSHVAPLLLPRPRIHGPQTQESVAGRRAEDVPPHAGHVHGPAGACRALQGRRMGRHRLKLHRLYRMHARLPHLYLFHHRRGAGHAPFRHPRPGLGLVPVGIVHPERGIP